MVDSLFHLKQKQTSVKVEIIAGMTTFLTMAYIIFSQPNILGPTGMDKDALIAVTCIVSAIATIMTGVFANAPIAMAPGMGLNAIFAYLVVSGKMDWQTALGVVFLSGLFFMVLTLLGLRKKIVEAIPASLISAIAVGIGLFITFMGLAGLGIVVSDEITIVSVGPITSTVLIGFAGLFVMIYLEAKKIKGALLIGILTGTILAAVFGKIEIPEQFISLDIDISPIAMKLDIIGALKWSFLGSIFTLMFVDMFDSIGTLVACCGQAGMVDENNKIKGLDRLLGIDAIATMAGALFGTSTTTSYAESAAGIEQGGRTGLTSIVAGLLFLLALLFIPVVRIVPEYATAPALIMVGLFMMKEVKKINFGDIEEAFPAFIIMVMIALSYSISTGLAFGFISFTLIKVISGKAREIKAAMWVIAVLSTLFLMVNRMDGIIEYLRGEKMEIEITSSAFEEDGLIPSKYTCDGVDVSPPLQWSSVPEGTKSIALISDDPDAPVGTWVHWVIFGLPAEARELEENIPHDEILPNGAIQGTSDFGRIGYGGPCPPGGTHRYFFKIYALDTKLDLAAGTRKSELLDAMEGHILGQGQLIGKYKRN